MHVLFAISLVLQIALAAHAYQHGRTSPWVWIILFFPLVGSLLYVFLFLMPRPQRTGSSAGLTDDERRLRRVPRGPFAPRGDRPDDPVVVRSVSEIDVHARREDCPECDGSLKITDHRADTIAGRRLRVVVLECTHCGAIPIRYFEIEREGAPALMH